MLSFTPLVPGDYTIVASFEGSGAYYGSFAKTGITVQEPPVTTPAPTPTPASVADLYFVLAVSGIIVAIIIVGALLALLLLRRRRTLAVVLEGARFCHSCRIGRSRYESQTVLKE
jgi:hypothetical protein